MRQYEFAQYIYSLVMYFTYILGSQKDGTFYYGSTNDLEKRIKVHYSGKVRYTKGHRPYILHYFEKFETRKVAVSGERYFKSISGHNWLKYKKNDLNYF